MSPNPVVEDARPGPLPISIPAARRLAVLRAAGGVLYTWVLLYAPAQVTGVDPSTGLVVLAGAVAVATAYPTLWTNTTTRLWLIWFDLASMLVVLVLVGDKLLFGAFATTVVVADASLPRRFQRAGLLVGPVLVGVVGWLRNGLEPAAWTSLFVAAVLMLITRARQEADRGRHQAARLAAAVNRVQQDVASSVDGMAWRAERARPASHDIAAVIGGMYAMATRVRRLTGRDDLVEAVTSLRDAYDRLADRLSRAADLAQRNLRSTVPLPAVDDADRSSAGAPHLGRLPLHLVVVSARTAVYVAFGLFVLAATPAGTSRTVALVVTVTGLLLAVPMAASTSQAVAVTAHVHDAFAIAVATLAVGGLTGPIAPVVVGQAAIVGVNVEASRDRRMILVITSLGLLTAGAASSGGPPGAQLLIAGWWIVTLNWGHVWFRQIVVHSEAIERWLRAAESNRQLTRQEAHDALRLASEVDAAFDDFATTARAVATACLDDTASLAPNDDPLGRAAGVLRDEATHLLGLVDDLTLRRASEVEPLTVRTWSIRDAVVPAISGALEDGTATFEDRSGGRPVATSRHHVERILRNLVSNALRYRRNRAVAVVAEHHGDSWSLSVTDDGPGLTQMEFARLRGKYTQGGEDDRAGQLGLGLWITSRNVDALGGSLQCQRHQDGFTITVSLPTPSSPGEARDDRSDEASAHRRDRTS